MDQVIKPESMFEGEEVIEVQPDQKLLVIKRRAEQIITCKRQIAEILAWDDITSDDRIRIEELERTINIKKGEITKLIDEWFSLLFEEILSSDEVVSPSSRHYESSSVVASIKTMRGQAERGEEFKEDSITRANNIRERVMDMLTIIVNINK